MRTLVFATRNVHKTREMVALLGTAFDVVDLTSRIDAPHVEETGATFAENAKLKALAISRRWPNEWVFADDSGLEVDALDGAPGVLSARYAGPDANDRENVAKLLADLRQRGAAFPAAARFRCVIALARSGNIARLFEGSVEGAIVAKPLGAGGFGYDPVFVPRDFTETFAQIAAETKNRISHRARAAAQLREFLLAEKIG